MTVTRFANLPMADRSREWDGAAAEKRVRRWADAQEKPNAAYRKAHVWYDGDRADRFTSYKLLIADVVGGDLKVVPRGLITAGNVIEGSRGGIDLPKSDIPRVRNHLAKYYEKMGDEPPWER